MIIMAALDYDTNPSAGENRLKLPWMMRFPSFLQTAWSYVVRDIDRTVQTGMVSESVFKGCSMYTCSFLG